MRDILPMENSDRSIFTKMLYLSFAKTTMLVLASLSIFALGPPTLYWDKAPVQMSPAEALLVEHKDCWQAHDEPKATLPSAAIVRDSSNTFYTRKPVLVDEAFKNVLAGLSQRERASDLEVIALCI